MADYRISGVWKNGNNVITHYAFHMSPTSKATKIPKTRAIELVEEKGSTTYTWDWGYQSARWLKGELVHVVGTGNDKYLRSDPNKKETDNLDHLIDYDWILP